MTEENEKEIEDTSLVKEEENSISMAKAEESEIDDVHDEDIHDDEDTHDISDNDDDQINNNDSEDFNNLDLDALYEKARECLILTPREALNKLKAIRPVFFEAYQSLKKSELEKLSAEEIDDFKFDKAPLAEGFNQLLATVKSAIGEERKRIEDEKENNYKHKLSLLDTLSTLVSEDETEHSISKVKEIQKEWKNIKVIPKDKTQELWDKYHMLLDKFYDNHSINIELKELDRKKNLEAKIELTKKVEEIANENSLKRSFILLNKYHEDFRNTGPVPQESREGIWQAFKAASDHIYQLKKEEHDAKEHLREENYKLKTLLVEKTAVVAQVLYESVKDWNSKTKEIEAIFGEWKSIGPVPRAKSDAIWNAFKKERAIFYNNRKNFFNSLNKDRKINLKLKETLCERVEAIKDNDDLNSTTKEILEIQKEWKTIGPVPDKINQAVWGRFRKACDHFFARKEKQFSKQRDVEKANLAIKKEIISKIEILSSKETSEAEVFEQLKQLSAEWNSAGFIPRGEIKKINSKYDKLTDELYKKFKKNREDLKSDQWDAYYSEMLSTPNGNKRLSDEEYKLKKQLKFLQDELITTEQNMSFFTLSKSAGGLLKDFDKKLEKSKSQVERIKKELKVISAVKRSNKTNESA